MASEATPEPSYSAYDIEVRGPDGTVIFHADAEYARTALDAARRVLRYGWPKKVGDTTGPSRRTALVGLAQHRITAKPSRYACNGDSGEWSVGQVLIALVEAEVAERTMARQRLAEATAALKAARSAYRTAQSCARCAEWDVADRADDAVAAGVDPAEVEKVRRQRSPRARKPKDAHSGGKRPDDLR